jgi:Recombination endonuclease VII
MPFKDPHSEAAKRSGRKRRSKYWKKHLQRNRKRSAAWHRRKRKIDPKVYRDRRNRSVYGLPMGEFDRMLEKQDRRCANPGCRVLLGTKPRKGNTPCVDHNEKTKKYREILCANCNIGLGHLKESPIKLQGLIDYLKKHGGEIT